MHDLAQSISPRAYDHVIMLYILYIGCLNNFVHDSFFLELSERYQDLCSLQAIQLLV